MSANGLGVFFPSLLFRPFVQDARDLLARVPRALLRPIHVLRLGLQHADEDLLYLSDGPAHLPDEVQGALLHDV